MNPNQDLNIVNDRPILLRHALEQYISSCAGAHDEDALPDPGNLISGICEVVFSPVNSKIVDGQSRH